MSEIGRVFLRTCQECGNQQPDTDPGYGPPLKASYTERKCRKCKSASLDYGSYVRVVNVSDDDEE